MNESNTIVNTPFLPNKFVFHQGQSEDMHTWFFLYDEKMAAKYDTEPQKQVYFSLKCLYLIKNYFLI